MYLYPNIFNLIAEAFCHRALGHSFFIGEVQLPFCARCTGIYIGIFIITVLFLLVLKQRRVNPPSLGVIIICIIFILYYAFDAVSSAFAMPYVNNYTRLLAGMLFGVGGGAFILLALEVTLFSKERNKKQVIGLFEFIIIIVISLLIFVSFLFGIKIIIYLVGLLSVPGFIILLFSLNFLILSILPLFGKRREEQNKLKLIAAFSILLLTFEIISLSILRDFIISKFS